MSNLQLRNAIVERKEENINIIRQIKLYFTIKREVNKVKEVAKMKNGIRTTEFLLTVIGSLTAIFFALRGLIPAD